MSTGATLWEAAEVSRERWSELVRPALDSLHAAHGRGLLPPALLLVGPPGVGRELVAVELAAMLTCPGGGGPGCDCGSCDRARRGRHPDVELVAPLPDKTQIAIEQVREVVTAAPGRPFEGVRRVWIFDGVEKGRLGLEAANALLKTLEEPPAHVRFVLLAANPGLVLPTIRSRCQQVRLPGAVAVAALAGADAAPPELGAAMATQEGVGDDVEEVRAALTAGLEGQLRPLLHLARSLGEEPRAFELTAAVALELGAGLADGDAGEELLLLAGELLRAEARTRALRLNRKRQLLSCLLRWQEGELGIGR